MEFKTTYVGKMYKRPLVMEVLGVGYTPLAISIYIFDTESLQKDGVLISLYSSNKFYK